MADLFYSTEEDLAAQVDLLKRDILKYAKSIGYRKKKLPLLYGEQNNIYNNVLVIQPPFTGKKQFEGDEFDALLYTLNSNDITNYFITYANPLALERHTKDGVKAFSTWISKLVELVLPKLIVALGEDAELVFFRKKFLLRDYHGKIIGKHNDIPVMVTFPFTYYATRSSYEDRGYKKFIHDNDWNNIKTEYARRIKCQ